MSEWRLRLQAIQEAGTTLEQTREEKRISRVFFQKIRRYEEGEGQGTEREFQKIPILKENVEGLYDWLIQLMVYIDKMVNYDCGEEIMQTSRIKVVIQIAANVALPKVDDNLRY